MNRIFTKIIALLLVVISLLAAPCFNVYAQESQVVNMQETTNDSTDETSSIQPKPDEPIPVEPEKVIENITFEKSEIRLRKNEKMQLSVIDQDGNSLSSDLVFSSSNKSIATVDSNGIVIGVKVGTAIITCKTTNDITATCKIVVHNDPTSIRITNTNGVIQKGSNNHKITYSLSNGSDSVKVKYIIKDTAIATVDSKGCIIGRKCGKTTLTLKTSNGLTARQTITVKNDSLSLNVNSTQIALDNKNVEKIKYGKSAQGRNLEAFVITNASNTSKKKTLFLDFAIHGFEDEYYRDGQVLTKEANALIEYFSNHLTELKNYKLVIVPCANPDGTIAGKNNMRNGTSAFGRCTSKHIDMNRDWGSFKAVETKYLKNFIVKTKPDFYLNMHGWLNETIGDSNLNRIINSKLGLSKMSNSYPTKSGFAIEWVHKNLKIPATLVEYKSSKSVSTLKDVNMIKAIIASNGKAPASATSKKYPTPVTWKNGSTVETVYQLSNLTQKTDKIKAYGKAKCYGKYGEAYVVVYNYGKNKHRVGFVKYSGKIKSVPKGSKSFKNGSKKIAVYSDTAKKKKIGNLSAKTKCVCLGKIDGMYLVVYKVSGTNKQKCGFVSYNGVC